MNDADDPRDRHRGVEWPTLAVAAAIYTGFGALTWYHALLPGWLVFALGGYLVAWHGSLQHEVVHGHPTSSRRLNAALVFPSLWLWMPFAAYRESHLAHHRTAGLTNPADDPESYYESPQRWSERPGWQRRLLAANNTVLGRLTIGPALMTWGYWRSEVTRIAGGDRRRARDWMMHAMSCTLVLSWVIAICEITLIEYVGLYAYPGLSLTLLRSYLEHRAHPEPVARTVVVEAGRLMSLLYLNNNLHAVHHAQPALAWYRLPARWRADREQVLERNGGYRYAGYAAVVATHLLAAKEPVAWPLSRR